jgi:hypothetical protein
LDAVTYDGDSLGPAGRDILDFNRRAARVYPERAATTGLTVLHRGSGYRGKVAGFEGDALVLQGPTGGRRLFPLVPGAFAVDGETVTLVRPTAAPRQPTQTASGSIAAPRQRAQVARAGRILVEGIHDAELVEKVWGDDLRGVGVVVERLDGLDHLPDYVAAFRPAADARLGVLADHLVAGSKEARLAESVRSPHLLVTGTPFVDVWQAVRPKVAGIGEAWPAIPRGTPWKEGVLAALGVADRDTGAFWRQLLGRVRSYADLEPALVGAVEQLIDFVTEPAA